MIVTADGVKYRELREEWAPVKLVDAHHVLYTEWLLTTKSACVSFKGTECTKFDGPGSFVVLDFGKELCGGIRMITRDAEANSRIQGTVLLSQVCRQQWSCRYLSTKIECRT